MDTPLEIDLALENARQPPVTRASKALQVLNTVFIPYNYYSIRTSSEDFSEGFCIVKAVTCQGDSFVGVYMENHPDLLEHSEVFYKETKTEGEFEGNTVISLLVSSRIVSVDTIAVHKVEIDDILNHANIEDL